MLRLQKAYLKIPLAQPFPHLHTKPLSKPQQGGLLDDDVVIQHDLSPIWEIDLEEKVDAVVKTYRGEYERVMSGRFRYMITRSLVLRKLRPMS